MPLPALLTRPLPFRAALLAAVACPALASAQTSSFPEGELFVAHRHVQGPGYSGDGVLRVHPLTGASSVAFQATTMSDNAGSLAYDPYRKKLIVTAAVGTQPYNTWLVDADGAGVNVGLAFAPIGMELNAYAPTGDGRIYAAMGGGSGSTPMVWLDAADVFHVLFDADGVTPMSLAGAASYPIDGMIHDAATQSLFVASRKPAPGFPENAIHVRKLPLSLDGSRVVGPIGNATFEVAPGSPANEVPRGFSRGPNGKLALSVLCISEPVLPRMLLVDPATLAITVYGSNGSEAPPVWAATTGGAYSSASQRFVVFDQTNTALRGYQQGSTGGNGESLAPSPATLVPGGSYYVSVAAVQDDGCEGAGTEYGQGLAGTSGTVPRLASNGCPEVGEVFAIAATKVIGGAPGLLLAGTQPVSLPVFGGTLLVNPNVLTLPILASGPAGAPGAGTFTLPLGFTDPALAGLLVFLQAGFVDAGAVQGLSLTNGLALEIG